MTTVGHSLTGLSVGLLCMPRRWPAWGKLALLAAFMVLANLPDVTYVRLYRIRHSIFVNLGLLAGPVAAAALSKRLRRCLGGWPVIAGAAAAVLSHLLLDSFYSGSMGIYVAWPFGQAKLNLSLPWFDTLKYGWEPTARTAIILGTELVFYGGLLGICLALRRAWLDRTRQGDRPAEAARPGPGRIPSFP